jgi:hypothetical protein
MARWELTWRITRVGQRAGMKKLQRPLFLAGDLDFASFSTVLLGRLENPSRHCNKMIFIKI